MCPPAESGGIGRARWIFAVRRRLFNGIPCGEALTGLLSATQAEMPRRRQPIGQDCKGLAARMADPTTHPDPVVALVVCLLTPLAMADDGIVATQRTPPRQQSQRKGRHPGSVLSSASGSAIKRITAGVRACRWSPCQVRSGDRPLTSCSDQCRTKKDNGIWEVAPGHWLARRHSGCALSWSTERNL